MKIGLVLEGGAMRGMYTAGALDVFLERGVKIDCAVGVSAGAIFGVNYISGQKGRVIRYNKRFNGDKNYMGVLPLLREGNIVSTKYAYDEVPRVLDPFDDGAFKKSAIPFYAAVSNIETGGTEYIKIESVFEQMDALRASGSMPFVSTPVEINGKKYLDGAVTDSVPFKYAQSLGCEKLIVVLTRDLNFTKKPYPRTLVKLFYHKYPNFERAFLNRHIMYNDSVAAVKRLEAEGSAFVVRPSARLKLKKLESDPKRLQAMYDLGVSDANDCMENLTRFTADSESAL